MKSRSFVLWILCGFLFGGIVSSVTGVYGASTKKKQCGGAAGATNGTCPKCIGNCDFTDGGVAQKYKVCEQDGDACANTVTSKCTGRLKTGGTTGQGCGGTVVNDDEGDPITCQNNPFMTCK